MTSLRTLNDIEYEYDLILKQREHLHQRRAKLDREIGDLNTELQHLEILKERLKGVPKGGL